MVTINCKECGKRISGAGKNYCSTSCASRVKARIKHKESVDNYNYNPSICKFCNNTIKLNDNENVRDARVKKFCNSVCSAKYNNYKFRKGLKYKTSSFDKRCIVCDKKLNKQSKKFCGPVCNHIYNYYDHIDKWRMGYKLTGNKITGQLSPYIRLFMLVKAQHKCQQCSWTGINPFTNKICLEVHHIDGDWRNNKEENLIVLCPNCHSMTETYRNSSKKGGGRPTKYFVKKESLDAVSPEKDSPS